MSAITATRYVPLPEAAPLLGLSQSAVRRRLRAGKLRARQDPTDQGFRWLIEVEDASDAHAPPTPDVSTAPAAAEAAPTSPPTDQHAELAAAREAVTRLETHNASLERELAARREEVSRLIVMLREAQRSLPPPVVDAEAAPGRPEDRDVGGDSAAPPPSVPWWRRFLGLAAPA